jgi:hypothetical protein
VLKHLRIGQPVKGFNAKAKIFEAVTKASKEYGETGPADDLYRFLKNSGLILHDASLHEHWFFDAARIPFVTDHCARKAPLPPFEKRDEIARLLEILRERELLPPTEVNASTEPQDAGNEERTDVALPAAADDLYVEISADMLAEPQYLTVLGDAELEIYRDKMRAARAALDAALSAADAEQTRRVELKAQIVTLELEAKRAADERDDNLRRAEEAAQRFDSHTEKAERARREAVTANKKMDELKRQLPK